MPEGPECKIITDQLRQNLAGNTIDYVKVIGGRYKTTQEEIEKCESKCPGLLEIAHDLPCKVLDISCKGKFIYWTLEKDWFLWNTLGMTGEWSFSKNKHTAFLINFLTNKEICFNDIRHFGTLKFVKGRQELNKKLASIGPDLLSENIKLEDFKKIILKQKKTLAEILMNQKIISGIGNYIKAEVLYRSKLSPWRICNTLTDSELDRLYKSIYKVLNDSYQAGGNTIENYKDLNGNPGSYFEQLLVYGKEKDPEGRRVIKETTPDKRTTYWCPEVQI